MEDPSIEQRLEKIEELTDLLDKQIALLSADLRIKHMLSEGDIFNIKDRFFVVTQKADSTGRIYYYPQAISIKDLKAKEDELVLD